MDSVTKRLADDLEQKINALNHATTVAEQALARADGYLDLIHQAIAHHMEAHPDCGHYRTVTTHDHSV